MKTYDSAMKTMRGVSSIKQPQKFSTEKRDKAKKEGEFGEASEPTTSSTTISSAQVVEIHAQVC